MKKNTTLLLFLLFAGIVDAGTITSSTASLPNFGNVYPFHSSTSQRYTVSGTALTANLVVTASAQYEVSLTYGFGYSSSLTIVPTSGTVAITVVYVRLSPAAIGSITGTISNVSVGSTTQNISLTGTCVAWGIPTSYYSTVNTQRGATLKTVLYNKILGHTTLSYTPGVWNAYSTTDVQPNGKVWDVYSTRFDQASPYEYTMVTNQCGSYSVEGNCYNREHSFPQSWFGSASPMVSDVHHVFASDGKVNGERGNFPYGNVTTINYTSLYGGKRGTSTLNYGYVGTVFEPIDEYKGDFARGYFYMATRYENLIASWVSNTGATDVLNGTSFPCFLPWQLSLLQEWNNLDPVSDKEMKRNNAIFALQNNRNPFIDSPQFVQRIWGGSVPSEPTIAASNLIITNNSNTSVTLNWKSGNGNRRLVLVRAGSAITGLPLDTFHYNASSNIASAPQIGSGNFVVYNGTGSSVTITNLTQSTNYYYAVIEYNGWYTTTNYQTTGYLTSNDNTLPVEFISFTANKQNEQVLLNWITASEINNKSFGVERSYDAQTWNEIGIVKGAGTTLKNTYYQYLDNNPEYSNIYPTTSIFYRLKQMDFDGKENYSNIVAVDWTQPDLAAVDIAPNPFTEELYISINSNGPSTIAVELQNLMGEMYVNKSMQLDYGKNTIHINDFNTVPAGVYLLHIQQQQGSQYFKIIKQ
jgi:endonuclease I